MLMMPDRVIEPRRYCLTLSDPRFKIAGGCARRTTPIPHACTALTYHVRNTRVNLLGTCAIDHKFKIALMRLTNLSPYDRTAASLPQTPYRSE